MVRIQAVLLSALLLLTACTGTASGTPQLNGTSWIVSSIAGTATVTDQQPTLVFADGRVSGSTGCNTVSGAYTQNGDGVTFSPMAVTQMACPEPVMSQETAFLAALNKVARANGDTTTVRLLGASGDPLLTLTTPPVPSPTPLAATTWSLESIIEGTTASSLVAGTSVTLTVNSDAGSYSGKACNNFGGDVTVAGDSITFGVAHSTNVACPADELAQENGVLSILPHITTWVVAGNTLTLTAPGNTLRFVAS
jgi:heat shock protein HslJ